MAIPWEDPFEWAGVPAPRPAMVPGVGGVPPKLDLPLMNPQEQNTFLGQLGQQTMGALGFVGRVLDKSLGGRAIRGLLAGKPRELLSPIPGSDIFHLTNPEDITHGQELLGYSKDDNSWGAMLGGLGASMALDPAMYLSLGGSALSKAGQVGKAAGILPSTVAARATSTLEQLANAARAAGKPIDALLSETALAQGTALAEIEKQALGGVAGWGLPFMRPSFLMGTGQTGANVMDALGKGAGFFANTMPGTSQAYKYALEPAGRYMGALFHAPYMGAIGRQGQEAAQSAWDAARKLTAEGKSLAIDGAYDLHNAGLGGAGADLRRMMEGLDPVIGPPHPELARVAQQYQGRYQDLLQRVQDVGMDVNPLQDRFAQFASRQWRPLEGGATGAGRAAQPLAAKGPGLEAREDIWRNWVEGTEGINKAALDPLISGPKTAQSLNDLQAAAHLRRNYLGMSGADESQLQALKQAHAAYMRANPGRNALPFPQQAQLDALDTTWKQADTLVGRLRELDPAYVASRNLPNPLRPFGNYPVQDLITYEQRFGRHQGAALAAHDLLQKTAVDMSTGNTLVGSHSVEDVLRSAGLSGQGGLETFARAKGIAPSGPMLTAQDLANWRVPTETAADIGRYMKSFQAPEAVSGILRGTDWLTNLTKAWETATWLAFHVRNKTAGSFNNALKAPQALLEEPGIMRMLAGEALPGAARIPHLPPGLSDVEATQQLGKEAFAHNVAPIQNLSRDYVGSAGRTPQAATLDELLGQVPGFQPRTLQGAMGELGRNPNWNPLDINNAPISAGRQIGDIVHGTNNLSLYKTLREQGYTPGAATKEVMGSHFDYTASGMTDFERNVMRRLVPFYRFARGNLPLQLQTLAENPGGLTAQLARTAEALHQKSGFLPDYLGQGMAIPVGDEQAGTKRFLTKVDLPPEAAADMLKGGPHWAQNTLMGLAGQMNPLIKAPLEYATGKQFYTGRDTADLYKVTPTELTEAALMNSPLSRFMTTGRTIMDPRKWENPLAIPVNLATGARLSDVDMEKQRQIAGREMVQEFLRGQPEIGKFQEIYVKPGMEGLLSPSEISLLRLNKTLEYNALEAAKARQKAG